LPPSAFAQDAKLIEAAKKEPRLVLYGTMQNDIFELLRKSFYKKTGITIDYWQTSATKVLERALSEARAGKALFDLVMATEDSKRIMLEEGVAKHDSPMNKDFSKDAIDPQLVRGRVTTSSASSTTKGSSNPATRQRRWKISSSLNIAANWSWPIRRCT